MWVKICANTNLEDAAQAAEFGADAVGFVFAESKRHVTPAQVAAMAPHLPAHVERVGVFSSRSAEDITRVALEAGLTTVQMHGGLDERLLEQLAGRTRIIQTLHWLIADEKAAERLSQQLERVAAGGWVDRVLIDSKLGPNPGSAGGGTGLPFDWAAAQALFASAPKGLQLILAGGLRPENVAGAIHQLSPFGVDVASGVESRAGKKDHARVAQFIKYAHAAGSP